MLRGVESDAEKPISEGKAISELNAEKPAPILRKVGRPSNAEKVATTAARLAAGELTQAQVDATLPPALAKVVKQVAKVSAEEFTVMLRGEYETLAKRVIYKAGEEVDNLKGFSAFLALGVIHDKLVSTGPSNGITHQTNIQINGVNGDAAAAIAGRFATKGVQTTKQATRANVTDVVTFPISGPQTGLATLAASESQSAYGL